MRVEANHRRFRRRLFDHALEIFLKEVPIDAWIVRYEFHLTTYQRLNVCDLDIAMMHAETHKHYGQRQDVLLRLLFEA